MALVCFGAILHTKLSNQPSQELSEIPLVTRPISEKMGLVEGRPQSLDNHTLLYVVRVMLDDGSMVPALVVNPYDPQNPKVFSGQKIKVRCKSYGYGENHLAHETCLIIQY
ncbi:MAG: hypothetical protein PHC97_00495 [Patescibacteria group bacterium]|nr:hypothetical protein [Patescibacteria group bacterium]